MVSKKVGNCNNAATTPLTKSLIKNSIQKVVRDEVQFIKHIQFFIGKFAIRFHLIIFFFEKATVEKLNFSLLQFFN